MRDCGKKYDGVTTRQFGELPYESCSELLQVPFLRNPWKTQITKFSDRVDVIVYRE